MSEDNTPVEPVYSKPSSQVDLEARLANGNRSDRIVSTSDDFDGPAAPDDAPGYIGVDPMYQNHANHTEAPGVSNDLVDDQVAAEFLGVDKLDEVEPSQDGDDALEEVDTDDAKHEESSIASTTPPAKKSASAKPSSSS